MNITNDYKTFKLNLEHRRRRFNEIVFEIQKKDQKFYFHIRNSERISHKFTHYFDVKISYKKSVLLHKNFMITPYDNHKSYFLLENSKDSLIFNIEVQMLPFLIKSVDSTFHTLLSCVCCSSFILSNTQNLSPFTSFIQSWITELFTCRTFPNLLDFVSLFDGIDFSQQGLEYSTSLLDKLINLIQIENQNIAIASSLKEKDEPVNIIYTNNAIFSSFQNPEKFKNYSFFSGITYNNTFIFKTKFNSFLEIRKGEMKRIEKIPLLNEFIRIIMIHNSFHFNGIQKNINLDNSIMKKKVNVALCQTDQSIIVELYSIAYGYLLFRYGLLFYIPDDSMLPKYPASLKALSYYQRNLVLSPRVPIKSKFTDIKLAWINSENQKFFAPIYKPDPPKKKILFDGYPQLSQDKSGDKIIIGFQQPLSGRNLKPFYFFPCHISEYRQGKNFDQIRRVSIRFCGIPNLYYLEDNALLEYINKQNMQSPFLLFTVDEKRQNEKDKTTKVCLYELANKNIKLSDVLASYRKITDSDQFIVIYHVDIDNQIRQSPISQIVRRK